MFDWPAVAGDSSRQGERYSKAEAIIARIPEGEEKDIVLASWPLIPKP